MKAKLLAMLLIGCSVISQLTSIQASYDVAYPSINLALRNPATASSSCYDEYPSKAVNGTCSNGSDKWCSGNIGGEKWLQLDLGFEFNINRWVVYHAGVFESNHLNYNTRDFRLQKSDDGISWYDVDVVVQNTDSITERSVRTFHTRYVRLYIDCGQRDNNDVARIYEFQLFYDEENIALNKPVTASKEVGLYNEMAYKAVNGTCIDSHDKWCTGPASGESKWLAVDLGKAYAINRWKVIHAGICENYDFNTRNFRLQASSDGVYWRDVDVVYDNTKTITDRTFNYFVRARYFRLWIDQATQYDDSCARIYGFELFEHPSYSADYWYSY